MKTKTATDDMISLLKKLISTPSVSGNEQATADKIHRFLTVKGIDTSRLFNNVWASNLHFNPDRPTLLLNSHHDTVKPNDGYTLNPYEPIVRDGKLFGLGSNDAGGSLVALLAAFIHFYKRADLNYNLVLCASAEEEITGPRGLSAVIDKLPQVDFAIVGEPTGMKMAIAEKGLMVIDCTVNGKSAHAAGMNGENAIYRALNDIEWFRNYRFEKISEWLGPVKMTVTVIEAGDKHNVIPDCCRFTVDVRSTDAYSHEEILNIIEEHVEAKVNPRSTRLKPSAISTEHPLVQAGLNLGLKSFGSPTLSDQSVLPVPSLKIGPGTSDRSHAPDEFICLHEIRNGTETYIQMLTELNTLI